MDTKDKPLLVLDANALIRDFWWEGRPFVHLRTNLFLGHRLVIPEIALLEAKNHLSRRISELLPKLRENDPPRANHIASIQRLCPDVPVDEIFPETQATRYETFIRERIREHDGLIVETPDVSLKEIVVRSVGRTKPFNRGDKGFRDTLIWYSILELLKESSCVSFVTANKTDFGDGAGELHPDLESETRDLLPASRQMLVHESIEAFILKLDRGGNATADVLRLALMKGEFDHLDLPTWIIENLHTLLDEDELDGMDWAGLPYYAEAPFLEDVEDVIDLNIYDWGLVSEHVVRIHCSFSIVANFWCSVLFSSSSDIVASHQIIEVDSGDWRNAVLLRCGASFVLRLEYDLSSNQVVSAFACPVRHDVRSAHGYLEQVVVEENDERPDDHQARS